MIQIQVIKLSHFVLWFFFLSSSYGFSHAADSREFETINIIIQDDAPLHVHPPGKPFHIRVKIDAAVIAGINYQWLDYQGNSVSDRILLQPGRFHDITSPDFRVGYYGLVFSMSNPGFKFANRQPGETREYGFAIIQPRTKSKRLIDSDSPFGIVHAQLKDPALPGWIKTLTWKTYSAKHWKEQIEKREQLGLIELPLIVGYEWNTDDTKAISPEQLAALGSRIKSYFEAYPTLLYWELGLEENLKKRFRAEHYWDNLEKKVKKIREIANVVNPGIRFIYQVAGLNIKSIDKFAKNAAAKHFDILSLHPYAWPDFIAPEEWLVNYLQSAQDKIKEYGIGNMPIWFTEVGVPHQGNYSGGFFGYPKLNRRVTGHSRKDVANYMVKLHVLALSRDVKKLFWYNYKDRNLGREKVENYFGLVDYWGYPTPAYVAYMNLVDRLTGKHFVKNRQLSNGLRLFEFKGNHDAVWVAWCYPECKQKVSMPDILKEIKEIKDGQLVNFVNIMGKLIDMDKNYLSRELFFITERRL